MNTATIAGTVSKTVETLATKTGKTFKSFQVEADSGGQYPDRFQVYVFGRLMDTLAVNKGEFVLVSGRVGCRAYANKDGEPRGQLTITANTVEVVSAAPAPAPAPDEKAEPDDDVPF